LHERRAAPTIGSAKSYCVDACGTQMREHLRERIAPMLHDVIIRDRHNRDTG
jgi:hypothetical protein